MRFDLYQSVQPVVHDAHPEGNSNSNLVAMCHKTNERYETASSWIALKFTRMQVVKQTVMTSVYGVTFVGARKQIQSQIEGKLNPGEVSQ